MTDTDPSRFSDERRGDLRRLGLLDAQIETLEMVLTQICVLGSNQPRHQDVRAVLDELVRGGRQFQKRLSLLRIERAGNRRQLNRWLRGVERKGRNALRAMPVTNAARAEALLKMEMAEVYLDVRENVVGRTGRMLKDLLRVTQQAISLLPTDPETGNLRQRRTNSAAITPIGLIHDALVSGWNEAHPPSAGPPPPFTIKVSSSANSPFREIVGICYETATGTRDLDPERGIRAYRRRLKGRERSGSVDPLGTGDVPKN